MKAVPCVLVLLALTAGTAGAQAVRPGDRIRVKSPSLSGELQVVETSADSLVVRGRGTQASSVARSSLTSLSVGRQRSRGAGALRGAWLGAAVGAGMGVLAGLVDGDDPPEALLSFSAEEKALMGGVLLGATGGAVGGIIGALAPGRRWKVVPLDPSVRVSRGVGDAIVVRASLAL